MVVELTPLPARPIGITDDDGVHTSVVEGKLLAFDWEPPLAFLCPLACGFEWNRPWIR